MYKKIEIHTTDFTDKYLLKVEDRTMYVGFLIKEIIELLQKDKEVAEITTIINAKHRINLEKQEIGSLISEKLNKFLEPRQKNLLVKFFKIFDPSVLNFPSYLTFFFGKKIFYLTFSVALFFNIFLFFQIKNQPLLTKIDWIIWLVLLFITSLVHELGHIIAAKKYNAEVHEVGFGIYSIFPVFYVELGEAWKLSTEKRIIINFSGIFTQLVVGFIFFMLYAFTNNSIFIHTFHTNFLIAIVNLNPFMKFDGYWVISDFLDEKNLIEKSNNILSKFFTLKKLKEKKSVMFYSIFRFGFLTWLVYVVSNDTFKFMLKLIKHEPIEWTNYVSIITLIYFICRTIINKLKETT